MGNLQRRERAEPTLPAVAGLLGTLALYATLPGDTAPLRVVVTVLAVLTLIPLVIVNPVRFVRQQRWSRTLWVGLVGVVAAAVLGALGETVAALMVDTTPRLVLAAVQVWVAEVGAFALLYWQLDRDGPYARRHTEMLHRRRPDLHFPEEARIPGWAAWFADYLRASVRVTAGFLTPGAVPVSTRARWLTALQAFVGFVLLATAVVRAIIVLL